MTVVTLEALDTAAVDRLMAAYGLELIRVGPSAAIPASYWGDSEAGLAGSCVFARADTPAHSMLHELCHVICMTPERRGALWRDAGGDDDEEGAVCYLQTVLADELPGFGRERLLADLDAWGYSFREGSAAAWYQGDGRGARGWLLDHRVIDAAGRPTWWLRTRP